MAFNAPLVSILIPAYNAERWVEAALESARSQTWSPCEIIVVDDGSRDRTASKLRPYESLGVRVISQSNRGAAAARNTAYGACHGEWIQYLDADDLLAPNKIELQLARGRAEPSRMLAGDWSRFQNEPSEVKFPAEILCRDADPVDWVIAKFEHHAMMHPAAWLVPRSLAEAAGPWNETLSLDDDGEYFTRLVLASSGVWHCAGARSYYRSSLAASLSRSRSDRAWESAFRSLELSAQRLRAAEDSPRTRHACATVFQRYIYEAYPRASGCRRLARRLVAQLGGSDLALRGGPRFEFFRRLLGWRMAKRLERAVRALSR